MTHNPSRSAAALQQRQRPADRVYRMLGLVNILARLLWLLWLLWLLAPKDLRPDFHCIAVVMGVRIGRLTLQNDQEGNADS